MHGSTLRDLRSNNNDGGIANRQFVSQFLALCLRPRLGRVHLLPTLQTLVHLEVLPLEKTGACASGTRLNLCPHTDARPRVGAR